MPNSIVPVMTSDNLPSPFLASASSEIAGNYAFRAFSAGNWADYWNGGSVPQWIQVKLDSAKTVDSYSITSWVNGQWGDQNTRSPKDWTFQGSNDGSTWTVLDTQTGQTNWTSNGARTFNPSIKADFLYYRLNITANNGDSLVSIYHISLFAPVMTATTTTLVSSLNPSQDGQSVTFTATVSPTSGTGKPTGTVTFYDGTTIIGTGTLS